MTLREKREKQRILGIHSGAIGDVIMFTRLLSKMDGEVTLVTGGEKGQMLKSLGAVEQVLDFDLLPIGEIFGDTAIKQCRLPSLLGNCDRVISCFIPDDNETKVRIGKMCNCYDVSYLPIRPPESFNGHLVEHWSQLLGWKFEKKDFTNNIWTVSNDVQQEGAELLRKAGIVPDEKFVVLHPGAGALNKCWALENFIEAGRAIRHRGVRPLFILGPAETERWNENEVRAISSENEFAIIKSPSLNALCALLFLSQAFIGNDSGPGHLAAGLGVKTLILFGKTNLIQFFPLGTNVQVVINSDLQAIKVRDVVRELE